MVPFAGYTMPVQFEGVKAEHLWTRSSAGLFDVSHMGPCLVSLRQTELKGESAHQAVSHLIEQLVPSDIAGLKPGQARLTVLLNAEGGILDDLIITRPHKEADQGQLYIVVNGAMKDQDFALFAETIGEQADLLRLDHDHVLMAVQGPQSEAVLSHHFSDLSDLSFMQSRLRISGHEVHAVSRCGYTGEDGFELLLPADEGIDLARKLCADPRVRPIGLGARDSLRLEAGLCLYGHDLDPGCDPVIADLSWLIQKVRRQRADFPGAPQILSRLKTGPEQKRVGLQPLERAPAREGTEIYHAGSRVGHVTSGGFGPSHGKPVAMGYIRTDLAVPGTAVDLMIRGKARPAEVCALPFIQTNYKR